MKIIKSHSGIRGIYGESLTPDLTYAIAKSYAETFQPETVIVGRDTRPSGKIIKQTIIAGLTSLGVNVIDVDIAPTPAILYAIKHYEADGGIIISASHNPPEWNALKFAGKGGLLLTSPEISKILENINKKSATTKIGKIIRKNIINLYIKELMKHANTENIKKAGFKVIVDSGGGAGALTTPLLLTKLGCKVITINSIPGLFTRKIEPTGKALEMLKTTVQASNADIGFAHDCDADRLACVDEEGNIIREDYGIGVAVKQIVTQKKAKGIVVNIASSLIFDHIANESQTPIFRSKVGEANVVRKIIETNSDVGAEGSSGGLILREFHLARDGAIAALKILEAMAERNMKFSELIKELPSYHIEKLNLPYSPNKIKKIEEKICKNWKDYTIESIDGIRINGEEWWILIRPSRTEPLLRIMVEAREKSKAKEIMRKIIKTIQED